MIKLYESSSLCVLTKENSVYLSVIEAGVTIYDFNELLKKLPQIKITYFSELQRALSTAVKTPTLVGELKEKYELDISADEMNVFLKINTSQEEIDANKPLIISEIIALLEENHIVTGIKADVLNGELLSNRKVLISEGIKPIPGEDSVYSYYKLSSRTPSISDEGDADFYELDFIDNVKAGDWLAEKTMPKPGIDGLTVKGNHIPARVGRDHRFKYDPKSVEERQEGDIFVLRAKQNGAVNFASGKISVQNHLIIHGNVDYETGNISFDGSITIKGTVEDKFSVEATGDIEIVGPTGIGATGLIHSKKGSIIIKGGVNGKGIGRVQAKDSIFVKYVNEGILTAENEIHVKLYAYDSQLSASKIYLDPKKGKIVGGETNAKHKVVTGSIGNIQERPTQVTIEGFDRLSMKLELDAIVLKAQELISNGNRMKRKLEIFEENFERLDERAQNTYSAFLTSYQNLMDEIDYVTKKAERLEDVLRTRGEGEIKVYSAVFPKTMMELKQLQRKITDAMKCSFYVKDNQIHTAD